MDASTGGDGDGDAGPGGDGDGDDDAGPGGDGDGDGDAGSTSDAGSAAGYIIQANRDSYYVVLSGSMLVASEAASGNAEVFEKVEESGSTFKLRASNGMFVARGASDDLFANEILANAEVFDTPACGAFVGLEATTDNSTPFVSADDPDRRLRARAGACTAAVTDAWEKFLILDAP
jgi:hypothetical protein